MILALALSPSVDVTYEVAAVKPQAVNRVQRATKVAGGKALNAARAAAALGASVRAVIPLGGEPGAWIARELQRDGVDATVVPLEAETRTCVVVVADDGAASSTDFYEPATPLSSDAWAGIVAAVEAALTDALPAWLLVSGSVPPGIGLRDLARLLDQARAAGVRTAVDSSGEGLRALVGSADLVKVNRAEAAELLGADVPAEEAARALAVRWACDAVVTDGVRPGAAVFGGKAHRLVAPTLTGRYPAGSGDAFLGGLVAALAAHKTVDAALHVATAAAEANAAVPGQGRLVHPTGTGGDDDLVRGRRCPVAG